MAEEQTDRFTAREALFYHETIRPGKIEIVASKPMATQRDLSLAYSPGVAVPVQAIADDPANAARYTARSNLVAVISNGTAILGMGNLGALASKPVMEGKAVLFKRFADVDAIDIELASEDPEKLIEAIALMEPSFGGINLEDIKAPECFVIEQALRERMKIPVMHDDQHGTAIISAAGLLNACYLTGRKLEDVKMVVNGAGASAIACTALIKAMGVRHENVIMCDRSGPIYPGRDNVDQWKSAHAVETSARSLEEALVGADVFLGLSAAGALKPEWVARMAEQPIIFAMANPDPEITPDEAKAVRPDAIVATGRSDYPNQVNNVLCFPFIFRGALDVGATIINEEMKLACVRAIAELAEAEQNDEVANAYAGQDLTFGPEYIIPKPFDPRLIVKIAPAVAQAAMDSGVATRPITDIEVYRQKLMSLVYHTGQLMRPLFMQAKEAPKRVIYADGEDERVLRAVQVVVDEQIAKPILVGRPAVIEMRIKRFGLRLVPGENFEIVNPEDDDRFNETWSNYYKIQGRNGVTPEIAKAMVRKHNSLIGVMLMHRGDADAMLCGVASRYDNQLRYVDEVIGLRDGAKTYAAMNVLMLPDQTLFICDTHVNENPSAEEIADMTIQAAAEVLRFGVVPKIALLSHSNFGSRVTESSRKMAEARRIIAERAPHLEVDGEMHADAALSEKIRLKAFPDSTLKGPANLLITPNLDTGNIVYNMLKMTGSNGVAMGPVLLGAARPVHILTTSATVRRIVNMTALAVVDAQQEAGQIQL